MTTTQNAPAKPLLDEWQSMSEAERRKWFSTTEHLAAAGEFAKYADDYRNPKTGNFRFPMAPSMALTLSSAAVKSALKYNTQTARALAQLVTLPVGSRKHQARCANRHQSSPSPESEGESGLTARS